MDEAPEESEEAGADRAYTSAHNHLQQQQQHLPSSYAEAAKAEESAGLTVATDPSDLSHLHGGQSRLPPPNAPTHSRPQSRASSIGSSSLSLRSPTGTTSTAATADDELSDIDLARRDSASSSIAGGHFSLGGGGGAARTAQSAKAALSGWQNYSGGGLGADGLAMTSSTSNLGAAEYTGPVSNYHLGFAPSSSKSGLAGSSAAGSAGAGGASGSRAVGPGGVEMSPEHSRVGLTKEEKELGRQRREELRAAQAAQAGSGSGSGSTIGGSGSGARRRRSNKTGASSSSKSRSSSSGGKERKRKHPSSTSAAALAKKKSWEIPRKVFHSSIGELCLQGRAWDVQ